VQDDQLGPVLIAQFVLHADERAGRPPEISLATRVEHWRRLLDGGLPIVPANRDPGTTIIDARGGVAIPAISVPLNDRQ
jgi:hypothetical protein